MFARVQTLHEPAAKLDELAAIGSRQLPSAGNMPGFKGFYYLIDRQNDKAIIISLWEAAENLRQLEAQAAVREKVEAEAGITSPPSEIFEVAVSTD